MQVLQVGSHDYTPFALVKLFRSVVFFLGLRLVINIRCNVLHNYYFTCVMLLLNEQIF